MDLRSKRRKKNKQPQEHIVDFVVMNFNAACGKYLEAKNLRKKGWSTKSGWTLWTIGKIQHRTTAPQLYLNRFLDGSAGRIEFEWARSLLFKQSLCLVLDVLDAIFDLEISNDMSKY